MSYHVHKSGHTRLYQQIRKNTQIVFASLSKNTVGKSMLKRKRKAIAKCYALTRKRKNDT